MEISKEARNWSEWQRKIDHLIILIRYENLSKKNDERFYEMRKEKDELLILLNYLGKEFDSFNEESLENKLISSINNYLEDTLEFSEKNKFKFRKYLHDSNFYKLLTPTDTELKIQLRKTIDLLIFNFFEKYLNLDNLEYEKVKEYINT